MAENIVDYLIVGGGLAGASAVEGIREHDAHGSITLFGAEEHLPYDRPPLTKKLWFGKKQVKDIFLHDRAFYDQHGVTVLPGRRIVALNARDKTVDDSHGQTHRFDKLLVATGGVPQKLDIPGGDLEGICYYRTLNDYQRMRAEAAEGKSAVIIGGGFIGSELAAALCANKVKVTMVYPSAYLCGRVFPRDLGLAMEEFFGSRGIRIVKEQKPDSIERKGNKFLTQVDGSAELIESDIVIAGVGIKPSVALAEVAGLKTGDGIEVNEFLQTSHPDIYAAGDVARFPYQALGQPMRVEHWDNALTQGRHAGRNMTGAKEPYTHMPYFFSDLFEFGYEAVGEVNSRLETHAEWEKPFEKGVIYYLRDGKIRGTMMCNVWEKVEAARDLIRRGAGAHERLVEYARS